MLLIILYSSNIWIGASSNIWIGAAFPNESFSGKTSLSAKNSYLLTFPDDKTEILSACLSTSYWASFSEPYDMGGTRGCASLQFSW